MGIRVVRALIAHSNIYQVSTLGSRDCESSKLVQHENKSQTLTGTMVVPAVPSMW